MQRFNTGSVLSDRRSWPRNHASRTTEDIFGPRGLESTVVARGEKAFLCIVGARIGGLVS